MKEIKLLKKKLETLSLTKEEKAAGREAFMKFMQAHPLPQQAHHSLTQRVFSRFYLLSRRPLATTFATLTVFVLFGSGISYAAQDSMPGELLYPIKIHVNEKVEGLFKFNPKDKAEWEVDRMSRRFEEVESLKENGSLDGKTKFQIRQQLDFNAQILENHLEELRNEGDEASELEIRNQFQNLFQTHEDAALDIEFDLGEIKDRPFPEWQNSNETEQETETQVEEGSEIDVNTETDTEVKSDLDSVEMNVDVELESETESIIDTPIQRDPTDSIELPGGLKVHPEQNIS